MRAVRAEIRQNLAKEIAIEVDRDGWSRIVEDEIEILPGRAKCLAELGDFSIERRGEQHRFTDSGEGCELARKSREPVELFEDAAAGALDLGWRGIAGGKREEALQLEPRRGERRPDLVRVPAG